jgi:glycosyltransferase involved in cell wall biosynthesis
MSGLTAIVTTFNEAPHIGETLKHLAFADEVLVIDSFSTDGTEEIARQHGATLLQHEYRSPAAQKNWAIPHAGSDWVLCVDADERVTPELAREIRRTVSDPGAQNGYEIKRRNFFLGREIRYCGWQGDWVLRLFRRDRGRYAERQVHEVVEMEGPVGRFLKAYLIRGGFLDGAHGLVVCLLTAVYAAAKDIRIWELQQETRSTTARQLPGGGDDSV